jgi:hypothetical protein
VSADVRVLSFSASPAPRRSAFALLDFDDTQDPCVVYVEGGGIARYLEKPDDWADHEFVWRILMEKIDQHQSVRREHVVDQGITQPRAGQLR